MATTSDRFWVATRKGLFQVEKDAAGWRFHEPLLSGKTVAYAVEDPRDGSVWASLDHGHWGCKLARRPAGGEMAEVTAPTYPEATEKSARYYWVLTPGHADDPDTFHVGTEPGGLFTTRDGGATWSLNQPLWDLCVEHEWTGAGRDTAGIHSICVDPRNPAHLHVGVSIAGVLASTDGGATWDYRTKGLRKDYMPPDQLEIPHGFDPHCVVQSPSHPDVLWQANHCGVYRTDNGGTTWIDVSDKPLVDFGFPVAVHPTDPRTAWIVPMQEDDHRTAPHGKMCVMRTTDDGATWTRLGEGLPQANAWDFPYRHALDVGADGRTLAFATTSGNVYVSEDGGETWTGIAHNLAPVYALTFA